jgi:serine/threonine-protein kinase HipA
MGTRGLGALEFKPAQGPKSLTALDLAKLVGEARSAVSGRIDEDDDGTSAALRNIIEVGTSAGGARAKAIVAWNQTTGELKSGQGIAPEGFTHWILKFDGMAPEAHIGHPPQPTFPFGRFEFAYYLMAKAAGIHMSESQMLVENNRAHFLTKRFDRGPNNEKIHMQTLCAMNHLDYKKKSTNSYEQLFMTMHLLNLDRSDFVEGYRRMVFNILSRNCDDHTKNFSFVLPRNGQWKFSPAYDLTFSHNPLGEWTNQHLMSVNGKWKDFVFQDLLIIADRFGIGEAKSIIEQVKQALSKWREFADIAGIASVQAESISNLFLTVSK